MLQGRIFHNFSFNDGVFLLEFLIKQLIDQVSLLPLIHSLWNWAEHIRISTKFLWVAGHFLKAEDL